MRERWARRLAVITCAVVLTLSAVFAASRNAGAPGPAGVPAPVADATAPDPAQVALGRAVYGELNCARCHSIAGEGSPRSPLDGIGSRLDRGRIRQWITGDDSVADDLSPSALRIKQGYRGLEPARLDALIGYLASLTQ